MQNPSVAKSTPQARNHCNHLPHLCDGIRLAGRRSYVCAHLIHFSQSLTSRSYNRYLAVAARVVRRSLKEGPRLQAERRGEMELRFARWEVSTAIRVVGNGRLMG